MKLLYLLIPLLLFSACSNEIGDDIKRGRSTVRIELQQTDPTAVTQNKTRASFGGSYHDAGDDIHNAYVVMYNNNIAVKKVERIINVPADAGETEYKSKQVTTITTENGDYLFYNFANRGADFVTIPATPDPNTHEVKSLSLDGLTFTVGSPLPEGLDPSPEKLDTKVTTCDYNNYIIPTTGIPMSDKNEFTIDKDQTITLTLYRMLAKMQFAFNNRSESSIFRIRGLKVGSITGNNTQIKLLPPKDGNNLVKTDFTGLQHDTTHVDVFTATADKAPIISPGQLNNTSFNNLYINESEANTDGQSFPLTITMDRSTDNGTTWKNDTRHALIQLTSIPRNNVAIVNINLTDFVLKLEASAYAPIGGYPAYVVKQNDDFYAYFSGSGDFELRPTLYEYVDRGHPERYINLNDKSRVTNYSLTVFDPQGIFSSQPAFDTTTGEILGTLAEGRTGTATVRLNLQLVTGSVTQNYTRTIYIVSK